MFFFFCHNNKCIYTNFYLRDFYNNILQSNQFLLHYCLSLSFNGAKLLNKVWM